MIAALIAASGYFSKIFSCTARAPFSRQKGHAGESKAKNRIFSRFLLNRSLSDFRESSRLIISVDWLSFFIPKILRPLSFQFVTPNPDTPEPKKNLITKTRKDEKAKRRNDKFRAFKISCFRDEIRLWRIIKCKEITIKTLRSFSPSTYPPPGGYRPSIIFP